MFDSEKIQFSYIQCPHCGGIHEYKKSEIAESLVCLYCDNVFSTKDFQPYAIAYKKASHSVSPV